MTTWIEWRERVYIPHEGGEESGLVELKNELGVTFTLRWEYDDRAAEVEFYLHTWTLGAFQLENLNFSVNDDCRELLHYQGTRIPLSDYQLARTIGCVDIGRPSTVSLILKAEITLVAREGLRSDLRKLFKEEQDNPTFADTTLKCDGVELKCHSFILAARYRCFKYFFNRQSSFIAFKIR